MTDLLTKEIPLPEKNMQAMPSLWSRSGPVLLLTALAIALFKAAPIYWPLTLCAFLGYAAVKIGKKTGLLLSLAALCAASIFVLRSHPEYFWISVFSGSIALAFLLIYLGDLETQASLETRENQLRALEEQVQEAKAVLFTEKQRAQAQLAESLLALTQQRQLAESAEKEKRALLQQCRTLSDEVLVHQEKTKERESDLESTKSQIAQLQAQLTALSAASEKKEETDEASQEEIHQLEQLRYQYALLREQFEEKSDTLDQTRKDLFRVENELLTLQKALEEKNCETPEEVVSYSQDLKLLEDVYRDTENQVVVLQDLVSSLLVPKKRSAPIFKKPKAVKKAVQTDLFEKS